MSAEPGTSSDRRPGQRLITLLGRSLSRDAAYYTIGMAAVFPLGIATALVSTHYLEPGKYGQLGLLMIFASLVTLVYGLGVIQGTLNWAYGTTGDEDDDEGEVEDDVGPAEPDIPRIAARRRRALGSGLALTSVLALVGTALLVASAGEIAELIGDGDGLTAGVIWAAISAAFGALWRLALQVYRLERRAAMYLVVSISRSLSTLVLTAAFLGAGYGLVGALAAVAIGTALSLVLALVPTLSSYAIGFRPADFAEIGRRGRKYVPIVAALWLVGNADLWVLSRFSTGLEVGLYRLASRFGVLPSYVTSAYLMAWVPLQRSSLFRATAREHTPSGVASTVFTYYCIGAMGLLLMLTVCSELFIGLAPKAYADAAPYIPAVAASVSAQGAIYGLYRVGRFRYRRLVYTLMLTLAAVVLAVLGSILAGPLGGYGVALAGAVGSLMGSAGMVIAIQRARKPIPFQWARIGGAVAIGAGLILLVSLPPAPGPIAVALDIAAPVLYVLALLVSGIVPRRVVPDLADVMRATVPRRAGGRSLTREVAKLPVDERRAILRWVGYESATEPTLDVDPRDRHSFESLTRGLRRLRGGGQPSELDVQIGAYLVCRGSHVDRDLLAEHLIEVGCDALELHLLDDAYQTLRQARRRLSKGNWDGSPESVTDVMS